MDKEIHMQATGHDDEKNEYTTPRWVQAWFLQRSRNLWRRKYKGLKVQSKRLQNEVNDVTKSRKKWRDETKRLQRRVRDLQAEIALLKQQALKKDGSGARVGSHVR
jgi:SMC interacting uncharacterized protein involved in chromosome segregation